MCCRLDRGEVRYRARRDSTNCLDCLFSTMPATRSYDEGCCNSTIAAELHRTIVNDDCLGSGDTGHRCERQKKSASKPKYLLQMDGMVCRAAASRHHGFPN